MKPKNCLIFGASGQIGRNLIRSLTKNNIKVTALTRNIHQKGYILKTQANPGYLEIVEGSIFDHELIEQLFNNADLCVNLIGILFDNFTTQLMTLLGLLPIFPIYYNGKTKFRPIFCSDLTNSITKIITDDIKENIIEFAGPDEMTFKEILEKLLFLIGKKRLLLPMPISLARMTAHIFELLPKPLITNDQLRLLKYDNVLSGKYKNNNDFEFNCSSRFEEVVNKYSYMWKNEGEYSKKR